MNTNGTGNIQSNYNLRKPITQTKHMKMGVITDYALILLWMHQNGKGKGFTKKQLVKTALDINWGDWTPSAYCSAFAAFNDNDLLLYNTHLKLWYQGDRLQDYLEYHFGPYTHVYFQGESHYDAAILYNEFANQQNEKKKSEYKRIKEIGREFFFQD